MKPTNHLDNLRFIVNTESPDTPRYQWASRLFKGFAVRERLSERLRREEELSLPHAEVSRMYGYVPKKKKKWTISNLIKSILP